MNESPSQHYIWNLSGQVLFLYAVAAAIFYAVMIGNIRMIAEQGAGAKTRKGGALALLVLISLASNFIGAATVAIFAKMMGILSRQSMVAAPLLLLVERHLRLAWAAPKEREAHAYSLLGGAAGMLAGAGFFLRADAGQEVLARVTVPGDVVTMPVGEALRNPAGWTISVQLVVFYCVSLALFDAAHYYLKRASKRMSTPLREGREKETMLAFASAVALNFLAGTALALLGRYFQVQIRWAMLLLPLLIVLESYVKLMREDASNRRAYLLGISGSSLGLISSAALFLRGAPIH